MQQTNLFISNLKLNESTISNKDFTLNTIDASIYTINLSHFIDIKSDLSKFLNSKEIEQAERFHRELEKDRFIIYRSVLKFILAAYTKLDIQNIYFDYCSNKKPYLASHPYLHFNISHSEDYAAIAISHKKIGIDIEYIAKDFNFKEILPSVFSENEILMIQNATSKKNAFYTLWTRKEAFVKALGKGIDEDFKYIPCLDGKHNINSELIKNTNNWQLYSFDFADHYLAAVAFEDLSTDPINLELYKINTLKDLLETLT